jgi:hypothetical protein
VSFTTNSAAGRLCKTKSLVSLTNHAVRAELTTCRSANIDEPLSTTCTKRSTSPWFSPSEKRIPPSVSITKLRLTLFTTKILASKQDSRFPFGGYSKSV